MRLKFILLVIIITSCKKNISNNKYSSNYLDSSRNFNIEPSKDSLETEGIIRFNVYPEFSKIQPIIFTSVDSEKAVYLIQNDSLINRKNGESEYFFDSEFVMNIFGSLSFYPDYGSWCEFGKTDSEGNYIATLKNGETYKVEPKSSFNYISYENFLIGKSINLKKPINAYEKTSDFIKLGYYLPENVLFEVLDVSDRWIQIKGVESLDQDGLNELYKEKVWITFMNKNVSSINIFLE